MRLWDVNHCKKSARAGVLMNKPRIYGILNSRALRPLWAGKECGLDVEQVQVGLNPDGTQSEWFRKINPNANIPVLQDGDLRMWESLAINLYLAKRYGNGLYPDRVEDEAQTWQWTLWAATELEPHVVTILEHRSLLPPEQRSQEAVESALAGITRPLNVLDRALSGSPHLLGDRFTIADLNLAAVLYPAYDNKWAVVHYPNVMAWLVLCWARPAAKELRDLRSAERGKALDDYWTFHRSGPK
jgi:glutathione S-transferase